MVVPHRDQLVVIPSTFNHVNYYARAFFISQLYRSQKIAVFHSFLVLMILDQLDSFIFEYHRVFKPKGFRPSLKLQRPVRYARGVILLIRLELRIKERLLMRE